MRIHSPWTAAEARPLPVLPPPAPSEEPPPPARSRAVRAIGAVLLALSVAPTASAGGLPKVGRSSLALAGIGEDLGPRYQRNEPLLRGMMAPTATAKDFRHVLRDLGHLPTGVLQRLADANVRIVPLDEKVHAIPADALDAPRREAVQRAMFEHPFFSGLYVGPARAILVRRHLLADPAPGLGHHRVLLHEVGHAVDHLLGERDNARSEHLLRDYLDALFKHPERFPNAYARETRHEYYAQCFEGWLTRDRGDRHEAFDRGGNRAWLERNNPEMARRIEADLAALSAPR